MDREDQAKQSCMIESAVVLDNAVTSVGAMKPELYLLNLCRRTLAEGRTHNSFCTCARSFVSPRYITNEAACEHFSVKLTFKEDKLAV